MASAADGLVKDAIQAYQANDLDKAQDLLLQATEADEENEQAWLWLSLVVEDDEDKRVCLENVVFVNENNTHAQQGLEALDRGEKPSFTAADLEGATSTSSFESAALDAFDMGFDADDSFLDDDDSVFDDADSVDLSDGPFGSSSLDLDLGLDDDAAKPDTPPRPKSPVEAPAKSPAASPPPPQPAAAKAPPKQKKRKKPARPVPTTMNGLFELIPSAITPTRVPGTVETNPIWLKRGIVILGVLNVVMVILLVATGSA